MPAPPDKSLMRNLGEFFGHIVRGFRADPGRRKVLRRTVQEERRGDVVLRRTTIDEVEIKKREPPA